MPKGLVFDKVAKMNFKTSLLRCSILLCNWFREHGVFVKRGPTWRRQTVHGLASETVLSTTVLKLDFSHSYKYEAHLLLTIF